jgi:alpha-galactosidase
MKITTPTLHLSGHAVTPIRQSELANDRVFHYENGLQAEAALTRRGGAVEWKWTLRNTSAHAAPPVTKFCPLALEIPCRGRHAPVLHGSGGGLDSALFPPPSFAQWSKTFPTAGLAWGNAVAASSGGRSSNRELPFFVLENLERTGGVFLGLGWSGDWRLIAERIGETVMLEGGMTHLHLVLRPGESFSQPTVLIGEYSGDAASGQRALRRYLRDFVQPALSGKPIPPLTFWNNYYGDRGRFVEADALNEMPRAAALGLEYFVLDGGWTGGGMDARFESLAPHIGSWRLSPQKFPGGWEPLKNRARENNLKLGVWFDLERAHPDSLAYREHPELFSEAAGGDGLRLLRLELDAAREWALETLTRVLRQSQAQWIRFDFNTNPATFWAQADAPDRRGATEIRYLENLYLLWDELRARFPALVIENCASGGRRIDLETLRCTHTDWISDHSQSEAIVRFHLHGATRWLPSTHLGTSMAHAFLEPHRAVDWTQPFPAAAYLSHFGGTFSVSDRLQPISESAMNELRRVVALYKTTAPCFAGEVFPVGQQNAALDGPCGLAGIDAETGKRAVVFFGAASGARDYAPQEFTSLFDDAPQLGDAGSDQFSPAYLWTDAL